jgi:hypothetical protein
MRVTTGNFNQGRESFAVGCAADYCSSKIESMTITEPG